MAKVNDIESILDEIKGALQSTLNTKIDAISAEKADNVTLRHVDANAYSLQTLNDKAMAFDPFILYGLDDPRSQGIGPATMKNYKITVVLCSVDNGQDAEIARKMFRYSRALEETVEAYFAGISSGFRLSVESLAPVPFTLLNSSEDYRAVGVTITVGMA